MLRCLLGSALLCLLALSAPAQTKLLRYPDLHGNTAVFSYAGDLWKVSAAGGMAVRLTAHPGRELFPRISPDGRMIAFTGQYDGDEQVYVIPIEGGEPRQLTFYPARGPLPTRWGFDSQVYGWSPDGKAVLFRSMREGFDLTDTRLYLVPLTGGLPVALEMPVSGGGDLSPDGKRVVYSPLTRDFRSWKRYQGGWAQDLYLFDRELKTAVQITEDPRTDRDPMWIDDRIVFASDRNGTLNLWQYDTKSGQTTQLTDSTKWDVRWPAKANDARIIFELDGELQIYDLANKTSRKLQVSVPSDGLAARERFTSVENRLEHWSIAGDGKRAVVTARGDVFTVPVGKGPTRNLTTDALEHAKWPAWSPDGKTIVFVSDRSGEEELWMVAADGAAKPERLLELGPGHRYAQRWSPDGARIGFTDEQGRLWVLTLEGRALEVIADEQEGLLGDWTWAPCGQHIALSLGEPSGLRSIFLWSVAGGLKRVTSEMSDDQSPAFDARGDYLYFLSARSYAPRIGRIEWNYSIDRNFGLFAIALRKDLPHPFPPESEEVSVAKADAAAKPEEAKTAEEKTDDKPAVAEKKATVIDFEGLADRIAAVPLETDNFSGLSVAGDHLVYVRGSAFYYGRGSDQAPEIRAYSLKDRKAHVVLAGASGYALSHDGKHLLASKGGKLHRLDPAKEGGAPKTLDLSELRAEVDPVGEYAHIFHEVWRRFRDYFYARNMHGYDWEALRAQYASWLPFVRHRDDLNYVIGEMISELNVGHAYISDGDFDQPERPKVGLLGATFALDAASGRYRIEKILRGDNAESRYRSPLTEIGVDAREGDYVLAIDGRDLGATDNPYDLLRHKADHPVRLLLNASPSKEGAREVSVRPITNEADLYYHAFVERNRERVAALSDGRVGYIHIPDMGADGIEQFIKSFYPQIRKEGLVIDVRNNGGGNVSQMILERLGRKMLGTGKARTRDSVSTYPYVVFHGHMVCLLNENSASDGDIFPHRFREMGLGPLIGKRSWGGVIGIAGRGALLDGGDVRVPEFGFMNERGEWIIEGIGVPPDIEVANDPASILAGKDPQLERGVQEVLRAMEANPKRLPAVAPDPVRTK